MIEGAEAGLGTDLSAAVTDPALRAKRHERIEPRVAEEVAVEAPALEVPERRDAESRGILEPRRLDFERPVLGQVLLPPLWPVP